MAAPVAVQAPTKGFHWVDGIENSRPKVNVSPIRFTHSYVNHPMFQLGPLIEQAREAAKRPLDLYFDCGEIPVDAKWAKIPISEFSFEEVLQRIEHSKAWLIMKHVEVNPEYDAVLKECTETLMQLAPEPFRSKIMLPEMLIIISSPNRITPFHMDAELNFLVQVQGTKQIKIFNKFDRSILTEEEIERFYTVDGQAVNFKQGIEDKAEVFDLAPGQGVNIPINAPHYVKNGNATSVSLTIDYEVPQSLRANIYRANYLLRKMGLKPQPPGISAVKDAAKNLLITSTYIPARAIKKKLRP